MADLTSGPRPQRTRAGMDYTPPPRAGAFKAAGRHTARVRFIRRTMVLGAVFAVSTIAIITIFDPFRHLPGTVSIAGVGVNGTKVTLAHPRISGVQQGGGAYQIMATAGIQDTLAPSLIDLVGVDASVGMADTTTTHIVADNGEYDSKSDTMKLSGAVKIANTGGYTLNMKSALIDFRAGVFASHERVRIDLKGGVVSANDMSISNNGHVIVFHGDIASTFDPPEQETDTVPVEATP